MPLPDNILPNRGDNAWDIPMDNAWDILRGVISDIETDVSTKSAVGHTHTTAQVTGLDTALAGKAPTSHTHSTAQVTGLDTALAGKAPTSHTHTTAQVTGLDSALAGKAAAAHSHAAADISDSTAVGRALVTAGDAATARSSIGAGISDLVIGTTAGTAADAAATTSALAGKAPTVHSHAMADLSDTTSVGIAVGTAASAAAARTAIGAGTGSSNLVIGTTAGTAADAAATTTALNGKAPTTHTHTAAQISDASAVGRSVLTAVDAAAIRTAAGAAATSHTHTTANITGLDTALAGKASTTHSHPASQISDATTIGRDLLLATDAATARAILGAGTGSSGLVIGTTADTAAAGNHTHTPASIGAAAASHSHPAAQISDSTATGRSVLTAADAAAARTAIGAGTGSSDLTLGTTSSTAAAGDHTHTAASIGAAPTSHTHTTAQVTGLDTALAGKAASSHTHATADVTGLDTALAGKAASSHTHAAADISDATATGRSVLTAASTSAARTAIGAGTSSLVIGTTASTAAAGNHTHTAAAVGAAAASHTHTTAQVTGLDTALAGKAPTTHTHAAADISDSTLIGRSLVAATSASDARAIIGALSSNETLQLGTTVGTAAEGNHTHDISTLSGNVPAAKLPTATQTAIGAVELATQAEVDAGTDTTRAVTPLTLKTWGSSFVSGPKLDRAVFIGSSNVADSATAWPTLLCARRGWTKHNYAIGGTGYFTLPTGDRFRQQVLTAVAGMTTQQRNEVGHFFVGDASNDARSVTAYGNMFTEAQAVYSSIRANFPNARIVVLPVIWPADAQKYTPAIWSYDVRWNGAALGCAEAQRDALVDYPNSLFIDQSWTWLTGHDEWMLALQDVHPNAAGHKVIANYVDRALDGELVVEETGWVNIPTPSGYSDGHRGRWLGVKRRGWTVNIDGSMLKTSAISGFAEYGVIPYGFRPTYEVSLMATPSDNGGISGSPMAIHVYPGGNIRRYRTDDRLGIFMTGTYEMG